MSTGNSIPSSPASKVTLGAPVANNTLTLQNATGMLFPVVANGLYRFKMQVRYNAALQTTGARLCMNGPALSILSAIITAASSTTAVQQQPMTSYGTPTASLSGSGRTTGNVAFIEGEIQCAAAGNVQLQFASETNTSAITILAGSSIEYERIA